MTLSAGLSSRAFLTDGYDSFVTGRFLAPFKNHGSDRMLMRWFRYFLPKEERFSTCSRRHSQTVVQARWRSRTCCVAGRDAGILPARNQFENECRQYHREVLTRSGAPSHPFDRGESRT